MEQAEWASRRRKPFGTPKSGGLAYEEGDRVQSCQIRRRDRTVDIVEGGRDYEVTVEFRPGRDVKKMFAAFAKLEKL